MIYEFNPSISKFDEFKAEAQVLIPILKAARAQYGEEQANTLIFEALRAWNRERIKQVCKDIPGTPREKWQIIKDLDNQRTSKDDLEFEILKWDDETVDYDVSYCKYAELFRALGEIELGVVLVCDADKYLVEEVTYPEVTYTRTQTIMEGGSFCPVRWRIKDRHNKE